ncbi:MAG: hypothetical protein HC892_22890 [Saprospiraceae bacterium]|nr:hypothetical protein [Saprospiraceae bacterium]
MMNDGGKKPEITNKLSYEMPTRQGKQKILTVKPFVIYTIKAQNDVIHKNVDCFSVQVLKIQSSKPKYKSFTNDF